MGTTIVRGASLISVLLHPPFRPWKKALKVIGAKYPAFRIVLTMRTIRMGMLWIDNAPFRRYHFVTNPATGGTPIMLKDAIAKAPMVNGMA